MTFEDEYKERVSLEAHYILTDLIKTAKSEHYEVDIFIRHVLIEVNKMYRLEVEKW